MRARRRGRVRALGGPNPRGTLNERLRHEGRGDESMEKEKGASHSCVSIPIFSLFQQPRENCFSPPRLIVCARLAMEGHPDSTPRMVAGAQTRRDQGAVSTASVPTFPRDETVADQLGLCL